jgi:hypothetical protein
MIYSMNVYRYGKTLFFLIILLFTFSSCGVRRRAKLAQISDQPIVRKFNRPTRAQVDSLMDQYGNKKTFVNEFIEPTLIALSYFPELKDVKIKFKYSEEATTMAARPVPLSLFSRRKYVVLINDKQGFQGIFLKNVPFNAQIGLIAHELAHIADYQRYNLWGVLGIYFRYSSKEHKPLFEKEIDKATIERGLGWQLYDWATYSMVTDTTATDRYRKFKRKNYIKPERIRERISFLSKYGSAD